MVFTRRLREMNGQTKACLAQALKTASAPAVVRSAFDLPAEQRAAIQKAMNDTFAADIHVRFETAPDVISGIELTANGQKIAWSIADYLASLQQGIAELLKERNKPAAKAKTSSDWTPQIAKRAMNCMSSEAARVIRPFRTGARRSGTFGELKRQLSPYLKPKRSLTPRPSRRLKSLSPTQKPNERCAESLQTVLDRTFDAISQRRESFAPQLTPHEVGTITSVSTGIARVLGLPGVGFEELVEFPGDVLGIAFNVDEDEIGVVLLGEYWDLHAGDEVERTGRVMDVAVGDGLLGRVIDPLGRPLDANGPVAASRRLPIERTAPHIMDRAPVTVPLQTGIKVVDALIPIGRGQRELILGDRQTGKTAIAIDTILNQCGKDVVCVYCAIGQRASAVAKAVATLRDKGAMDYTVVVVTEGNDPPGLAFIAPYAATSIAESFMEAGHDVLIVYDDLTHHARAYRELSLLLRRPPGREAFPGDIFYIHSRLLERATHLCQELGGGSLTALPIIETEAQDISAYIPTNLISITDGQIYLSPSLFELGVLPAVDVGKSVSRVGGKAQRAAYRVVAGDLKLAYAQFEELETFSRFGARLDDDTRRSIEHGRRIRACLKQPEFAPVPVPAQIAILLALTEKLFDRVPLEQMTDAEHAVHKAVAKISAEMRTRLETADKLSDEDRQMIIEVARQALAPFQSKPAPKPKSESDAKSKPTIESESKPESKGKPDSKPKPEPESQPESKSAAKAKPNPEGGSKPDAPAKPELGTESKPKPDPKEKS